VRPEKIAPKTKISKSNIDEKISLKRDAKKVAKMAQKQNCKTMSNNAKQILIFIKAKK